MFVLNVINIIAIIVLNIISLKNIYKSAIFFSLIIFIYTIGIIGDLHPTILNFSNAYIGKINPLDIGLEFSIAIDGISLIFIILTTLLNIVCVLAGKTIKYRKRLFFTLLFIIEILLINVFAVTEIIYFYIFFEGVLIPMFLLIGIYGSRQEKIAASYNFFIYTLAGSLFMLIGILFIMQQTSTTNILLLKSYEMSANIEIILWLAFSASFAVKIPLFPFHLWLPKAHVESPTAGSVLLAGILLKLGSYGFLRFSLFLFPIGTEFFRPFIITLAIIGIIYSSFTILRQIDLKRIIAYSSISHMGFVILGTFGGTFISLNGAVLLMIAHGLVSGGLFLAVGFLYDRYKSRNLLYYRGLINIMPIYGIIFFILILGNIGFPPTLNFISEFLILSGIMEFNTFSAFLSGFGIFFAGISGFWVFTRIFYGNFSITNGEYNILFFYDLNRRELYSLIPILFLTIFLGFQPNYILNLIYFNISAWGY